MKKIFFALTILILSVSISYSQTPPTPATLPKPDYYTMQNILNNIFQYPDAIKVISVSSGTYSIWVASGQVFTTPAVFENMVSSGTSGKITATNSTTITLSDNVSKLSFKYRDLTNTESTATVRTSLDGDDNFFFDGDSLTINVYIPQAITFSMFLPKESTMTYRAEQTRIP